MKQAIILAGGKGERLRPMTEDRPKPMVDILGSPLLAYQLRWIRSYGIERVVICCGYRHEVIRSYVGDGSRWNLHVEYLVEDEPLGRGGALKSALRTLGGAHDEVLACNGYLVTNVHIAGLCATHRQNGPLASIVTVPLKSPYGVIDLSADDTVSGFREKPELPFWINAGIYVLNREIFDLLPDRGDHEVLTFPELGAAKRLRAYKTRAFWRTVDTVKDLTEIRSEMEEMVLGALFETVKA